MTTSHARGTHLITIAAIVAMLTTALTTVMAQPAQSAGPASFTDVGRNHQFHTEIMWLSDMGVTGGYADRTFRPAESVTREAFAAFLYRLAGSPRVALPSRSPFKDVPTSAKFFDEIVWLDQQGITNGWSDGTFRPKLAISREAIAAFLYRLAGKPAFSVPSRSPFRDMSRSAQFYREVTWLASTGITTGYADGTFRPRSNVQRQAIAAFLYRGSVPLHTDAHGYYLVGRDVFPGTYTAVSQYGDFPYCEWEIRDDTGTSWDATTGYSLTVKRGIVELRAGDRFFVPYTCSAWEPLKATSPGATKAGDGTYAIGYHLRSGTYRAPGGEECDWFAATGFRGNTAPYARADDTPGTEQVRVRDGDVLTTIGCGTWTRIGS